MPLDLISGILSCTVKCLCLIYEKLIVLIGGIGMYFKNSKKALSLLAVAVISGCSMNSSEKLEFNNLDSEALNELVKVSIETRDEFRLLAKSQEAIAQKAMTKEQHEARFIKATTIPVGFEKISDFEYQGKASKAAKALAVMAGYSFAPSLGVPPANEPWVHIKIKNSPLNDALKELGLQTGDSIRIEVYAKVMRLIYK